MSIKHWRRDREVWGVLPRDPRYRVSTLGRVIGPKGRVLSPRVKTSHRNYATVSVGPVGQTQFGIHILMLETFVGPKPDGHMALHWNDDETDNFIGNLYWGTHQDNWRDRRRNARRRLVAA